MPQTKCYDNHESTLAKTFDRTLYTMINDIYLIHHLPNNEIMNVQTKVNQPTSLNQST